MGTKLDRQARLEGLAKGNKDLIGHLTERNMWDKCVRAGTMCRAWDNGLVILHEGEFMNVYEREKDGSWSMTRTRPMSG